jgi:hypothetical protein
MRPRDTSPEAWKVYLDIQRRMSPSQKLRRTFEFSAFVNALAEGVERQKYPAAGEREIFLRLARRRLGPVLFRKVYGGELPDEEPAR